MNNSCVLSYLKVSPTKTDPNRPKLVEEAAHHSYNPTPSPPLKGGVGGGYVSPTASRISQCGSRAMIRQCDSCGEIKKQTIHCFVRYHGGCFESKRIRAWKRLLKLRKSFDSRCKHFVFTVSKSDYSKETKKFLERSFTKLLYHLRHTHHYQIDGIKIVDYNLDSDGRCHLHIHFISNCHYTIDQRFLSRHWKELTGCTYVDVRSSNTDACFDYFSKRIAGMMGHQRDGSSYFLDDVIDVATYDRLIRGSRVVTVSRPLRPDKKAGSLVRHVPKYFTTCPKCGGFMFLVGFQHEDIVHFSGDS